MRKRLLTMLTFIAVSTSLVWSQLGISPGWSFSGTSKPAWFTSSQRGFAYGNGHIIVPSNNRNVYVLDASNGKLIRNLDLTGVVTQTFPLNGAKVSADGSILVSSLTLDPTATTWGKGPFMIYRWKHIDSIPSILIQYTDAAAAGLRLGDFFNVVGDVTGNAVITAAAGANNKIVRWVITDGVVGAPTIITTGVTSLGNFPVAYPLGASVDSGFWLNGDAIPPVLARANGSIVDTIKDVSVVPVSTSHVTKVFTHHDSTYMLVSLKGDARIINITGKTPKNISTADISYNLVTGLGAAPSGYADVDFGYLNDSLVIYTFGQTLGIFAWAAPSKPIASQLALAGVPKINNYLVGSYSYGDVNKDVESGTSLQWLISDSPTGTYTELTGATDDSLLLSNVDWVGKYVKFRVIPATTTGTLLTGDAVLSAASGQISAGDPPVAINLTIGYDTLVVGDTLTGDYDYSDVNGDEEGVSTFKWYRGESSDGSDKLVIDGATAITYILQDADYGKYMFFEVTPVAQTGVLLTGEPVVVATTDTVGPRLPIAPEAINLAISGRIEVGGTLKGTYTYKDLNGDPQGTSLFKWYRGTAEDGSDKTAVEGATTQSYLLVAEDEGKWMFFEVTPDAVSEYDTLGAPVSVKTSAVVGPMPTPVAPVASDVKLFGKAEPGVVMFGTYTYSDRTEDPEGATIFKWYRSDDAAGTGKTQITGANKKSYVVTNDDVGKFISLEITPVATVEPFEGTPVEVVATAATVSFTGTTAFERVWVRNQVTSSIPDFFGAGSTERGMAVRNGKVYIASRKTATDLLVLNSEDGSYEGKLNTTGITGGTFAINDVEVSEDGQILACNLAGDVSIAPFKVYRWDNEASEPELFIEYSNTTPMRLGDRLTLQGDLSGDAVIWTGASAGPYIVRWIVTGGILGEPVVFDLTGEGISSMGSGPVACGLGITADDGFIADGRGIVPAVFDKDGKKLGNIPYIEDNITGLQATTPKVFDFKGRKLVAFYEIGNIGGQRAVVMDVTKQPADLVATDILGYTETMFETKQELGDIEVEVMPDYFNIYVMTSNNGLGKFTGTIVLPELTATHTSYDGKYVVAQFSKTMTAPNKTDASLVVTADGSAVAVDSVLLNDADKTQIFIYTSAVLAETQVVELEYVPGNLIAEDGMPLNAFGPVPVENLVNAAAPEAVDLIINDEVRVGATVHAVYTYSDPNGDDEGVTRFKWYYSTNADGSGKISILGETAESYDITSDMEGKYIAFQVTPVALTGGAEFLEGTAAISPWYLVLGSGVNVNGRNVISLYPNPVGNVLLISNISGVQKIELVNMLGKSIQQVRPAGNQTSLDMSKAAKGVYFVHFTMDDGKSEVRKIVKQ